MERRRLRRDHAGRQIVFPVRVVTPSKAATHPMATKGSTGVGLIELMSRVRNSSL